MSRTLTALFDHRADAETAKQQLIRSGVDAGGIDITHQGGSDRHAEGGDGEGFWASLKTMFVAEGDKQAYAEGIRRGGYLLSADVDEADVDAAVQVLDNAGSIDFDARQVEWQAAGWAGGSTAGADAAGAAVGTSRSSVPVDESGRQAVAEEAIPVVHEELRVGKREVERGGARVRSYVRE